MALSSNDRRRLAALGNRLKATVSVAGGEVSDAVVAHLRQALRASPLVKVRVNTDDRGTIWPVAERIAERVPCEVVQRIGRVLLLHRADDASD
ncbi:MAG: YhbY family RNA-binding protein [Phycisphaerae bacterium]|jgi:RNA-binding protein YhbY